MYRTRDLTARLPSSVSRLAVLCLIMLPFAAIGIYVTYLTMHTLLLLAMMQSWTVVPATLESAELSSSGSTNRAVATYSYVFQGKTYTGRRVSLYSPDNLGTFHEDTYKELKDYLDRKEPYPVHVNPFAPEESILKPVLRPEAIGFYLVFAVVFGGVGCGTLISACMKLIRAKNEAYLEQHHPKEPWKWRSEWAGSHIKSSQGSAAALELCFAIFWNAATFPVVLIVPRELKGGNSVALAFLIVPAIGIGLVYWALVALARVKRFGKTYLKLKTLPGRPGEPLRGNIYAPKALAGASEVVLTFRCETNSQDPAVQSRTVDGTQNIWKWESTAPVIPGKAPDGEAMIAIDIEIPPGLPSSWRGQFVWLLSASAPLKGADFAVEIEVPVFARGIA